MSTVLGRLTNQGDLKIAGELNSRIPPIKNGLLAYFPFDGTIKGNLWGTGWDGSATANSAIQDLGYSWVPLIEGSVIRFRGWFKSNGINGQVTFFCYHQVNGTWHWQGIDIQNAFKNNEWVYIERSFIIDGTPTDTQAGWGQGISLRNSCTSGSLQWKNCHCSIEAVATNCTIANDGIYVEDANTNLWNGLSSTGQSDVNWSVINNPFPSTPFPFTPKVIKCTPKSYMNYFCYNNADGTNYPSGSIFTMSAWVFVDKNCDCTGPIRINGEGKTSGEAYYDKTKLGTWQFLKFTVTSTDVGFYFLLYPNTGIGSNTWTKGNVYFACVQVEKKAYNTLYTPTTKNNGNLVINSMGMSTLSPWTVVFDYKHPDLSTFPNNMIFASSYLGSTVNEWFGLLAKSNTLYLCNIPSPINTWNRVVFAYDGTYTRIYLNGTLVYTYTGKFMFNGSNTLSFSSMTGWNVNTYLATHQIRNVWLYNRTLSATEIANLSKTKFKMSSGGDLMCTEINESLIGIPSDAYYFPLGADTKDKTKMFNACEANNLILDNNNALYVGTATTNLYKGENDINLNNFTKVVQDGWIKINAVNSNGLTMGQRFYATLTDLVNGSTYACSCDVYNPSDVPITVHQDWCYTGNTSVTIQPREIARISIVSSRATYDSTYRFYDVSPDNSNVPIWIRNVQIENKSVPSPYTPSARASGSLEYNLNSLLGLDWSKDWSIVYFKKPVATHSNALVGYCIESLGCNGNSVGGGYTLWGKVDGSNTFCINSGTTSMGAIDPTKYFNTWQMISLQKTGSTISFKVFTPYGNYTGTYNTTNSVANYYVTQYGYDFKVGGWDNGSPVNAYYRDLIVVKGRCMTDAEVTNIWKRKMSKKDSLYLQGQLRENMIL